MSPLATVPLIVAIPVAFFVVLGATLTLIGALGFARLTSFYDRLHAPTLATSWGTGATIIASALIPSDLEDAPAAATIVLENLDVGMTTLLRSMTDPASLSMAVVLASSPDLVEAEWSGLSLVSSEITADEITLQFSREEIEVEAFPMARLSRERFPGLHP